MNPIAAVSPTLDPTTTESPAPLVDRFGRHLQDLRISVTDRCNFRCLYCLPETEQAADFYRNRQGCTAGATAAVDDSAPIHRRWLPRHELLTFEEITRLVRVAVRHGIQKIRLTGGEPLLRRDLEDLVASIASTPGLNDLAMTTNGFGFGDRAESLSQAGLRRVTFSLDSLDRENFQRLTGRDGLPQVLQAIDTATALGMTPVKVNAVLIRGMNDHEIEALVDFAREKDVALRFIEFMPLDSRRAWQKDLVISCDEILERLNARFNLQPVAADNPAETALRWRFPDGRGELGVIAPVSRPFCGQCNRLRLTAEGTIRTCLFSTVEHDIKGNLRDPEIDDRRLAERLHEIVLQKEAGHRIGKADFVPPSRSMSYIGG